MQCRRKTQPAVVGFEDSRRLRAKEWRQPPAAGRVKETDLPLESAEGAQPSQHLGFSSVSPVSDF